MSGGGNSNQIADGLLQPTVASLPPGAISAGNAAYMNQVNMNSRQAALNRTVGGKKRMLKGGADSNAALVNVPQFPNGNSSVSGPGTSPNNQIAQLSSTSMQARSWSKYDSAATQMGGSKKYRKGGNSNWNWGCYSGGRSKRKRRSIKKHTKKTKRHYRGHRKH